LEEAGLKIQEELLSIMLLDSLSHKYENFNITIESREVSSLETLKAKLKEEEARQNNKDAKTNDKNEKSEALVAKGSVYRGK